MSPSFPMGSFKVGVIGFEPTTPCSQSVVLTVYFSMRDFIFYGSVSKEAAESRSLQKRSYCVGVSPHRPPHRQCSGTLIGAGAAWQGS